MLIISTILTTIDEFNSYHDYSALLNSITVINFNIRSFNRNSDQYICFLNSLSVKPKIVVFTETWLDRSNLHLANIDGYTSYHSVRSNRIGGGVSVFCLDSIGYSYNHLLTVQESYVEACVVAMKFREKVVRIIAIYRPPSGCVDDFLSKLDSMIQTNNIYDLTCITGDLNLNLNAQSTDVCRFRTLLQSFHFCSVIKLPIRIFHDPNYENSVLDHIWIDKIVKYRSGVLSLDITDHLPVFLTWYLSDTSKVEVKVKKEFRIYSDVNFSHFESLLVQFFLNFL